MKKTNTVGSNNYIAWMVIILMAIGVVCILNVYYSNNSNKAGASTEKDGLSHMTNMVVNNNDNTSAVQTVAVVIKTNSTFTPGFTGFTVK